MDVDPFSEAYVNIWYKRYVELRIGKVVKLGLRPRFFYFKNPALQLGLSLYI